MAKFAFRNPAFSDQQQVSTQQLDEIYNRASAPDESDVMTVQDTLMKTVGSFALLLVFAAVGWMTAATLPFLWIAGAILGLVLGLVNSFKREPSAPLILAYAAAEGLFVGGISAFYEFQFDGIVVQAVT